MTRILSLLVALSLAMSAEAADCPPPPDRTGEIAALFDEARRAATEREGREVAGKLWEIYRDAPDEAAAALLARGGAAQSVGDTTAALDAFDRLVEYCPNWAEGWNQRAFTNFLAGRFDRAVPDLREAIRLNPDHVGALSGLGLTLMALGEDDEAQDWLREAVRRNPWISERHLLTGPPETDL